MYMKCCYLYIIIFPIVKAKEMKSKGAHVIVTTRSKTIPDNLIELMKVNKKQSKDGSGGATGTLRCLTGIDVTDNNVSDTLITQLKTIKDLTYIDIVVNNAGYFYEPHESILENTLNMNEELSMIDICALGPLRITNALIHGKYLCTTNDLPTSNEDASINVNGEVDRNTQHPSKIVFITSQGGSIAWRFTQNPKGGDYGHHMSKAAANMMGVLVSQELKGLGISVGILHPGFNKTGMAK